MSSSSLAASRRSAHQHSSHKAMQSALSQRQDLKRTSVTTMLQLAGADESSFVEAPVLSHAEALAAKLSAGLPPASDALERARHFNSVFKPALNLRECIDFDDEVDDPIRGGNITCILVAIINSLRRLKETPQLRMTAALRKFFRAVRTMSRLIRRRNMTRHTMLLDVVKWWEQQEDSMRQKLQSDMQSQLFRLHHEISEIIEMKENVSIPSEVKFGILRTLYYRQRSLASKAYDAWRRELRAVTGPMDSIKRSNERAVNGRYLEPFESQIRALRRQFWVICTQQPAAAKFDRESITYEKLLEVRQEVARMKSVENRKRLISEFQAAMDSTKTKRRVSYVAMESRREEDYKKRQAERAIKRKEFDETQKQRQEIMNRKQRRSVTTIINAATSVAASTPRDNSKMSEAAASHVGSQEPSPSNAEAHVTLAEAFRTGGPFANSRFGDSPRETSNNESSSPLVRRTSVVLHRRNTVHWEEGPGSGEGTLLTEGSFSWGRRSSRTGRSSLSRTSSFSGASSLRTAELATELVDDPLAFLQKFGTAAYESALRKKEREFREQMQSSDLDEERQFAQQLIFRNKLIPTPKLEPFFEAPHVATAIPHLGKSNENAPPALLLKGTNSSSGSTGEQGGVLTDQSALHSRAHDPTLRVHTPVVACVRIRSGLKKNNDSATHGSSPSCLRCDSAPLVEAKSGSTSLMRPMTPGLSEAVSPWVKFDAVPTVEWLSSAHHKKKHTTPVLRKTVAGSNSKRPPSPVGHGNPLQVQAEDQSNNIGSAGLPPSKYVEEMIVRGELDISGAHIRDDVERSLHAKPMDSSSVLETIRSQKVVRDVVDVKPQRHYGRVNEASLSETRPAILSGPSTKAVVKKQSLASAPTSMPAVESTRRASFLSRDSGRARPKPGSLSDAYALQLQTIMAATGAL